MDTRLKVALHPNPNSDQQMRLMQSLAEGITAGGDVAIFAAHDTPADFDPDLSVIWSYKQKQVIATSKRLLIMEHGFFPPREKWISLALDHMGRLGVHMQAPASETPNARLKAYFSRFVQPWRNLKRSDRHQSSALLIGQWPKDPALHGADHLEWLEQTSVELAKNGHHVIFRPHPLWEAKRQKERPDCEYRPSGAHEVSDSTKRTLSEDLARARFAVTYSSNSAVDAVLEGIPTITMSEHSMAWDVTSHTLKVKDLVTPQRDSWLHAVSWAQCKETELRDGQAWARVKLNLEKKPGL
jgi:hypothetical protein